jgi:hypothetical protein
MPLRSLTVLPCLPFLVEPSLVEGAGVDDLLGGRLTVQEMNYGAQRVVEVQAPWTADKQWHRR